MAQFIDAHAHLFDEAFKTDLPDVIQRAKDNGVQGALVVAIRPTDFKSVLQLGETYGDFCWPCLGVHPVQGYPPDTQRSATIQDLEEAIPWIHEHHEKLFAIGEVGLDFTPRFCTGDDTKDTQRTVLLKQAELAKQYDLPLNVHSRSAGRPTIQLLAAAGAERVLLHAFDGRAAVAMEGVRHGYYFSIPPSIVRSGQEKLVKQLPIENILLETDSPALGPEKQVRNEPRNLHVACQYIAKVKAMDVQDVARIVWENTIKLFPKIKTILK